MTPEQEKLFEQVIRAAKQLGAHEQRELSLHGEATGNARSEAGDRLKDVVIRFHLSLNEVTK